jgi:hypothetical protein
LEPKAANERLKSIIKDINRDKVRKGGSAHNILNIIFDDILSTKLVDYTNLTKGRSVQDTRAILNYMLVAAYKIESRKQFDATRFFDKIIMHPTEVSPDGLYEGDIVLSKDQAFVLFSKYLRGGAGGGGNHVNEARKVIKQTVYRWPAGIIHFCLDPLYAAEERALIISALLRWEQGTCLEFKELECWRRDVHFLKFIRGQGCWSPVGYVPDTKYQEISIGEGCFQVKKNILMFYSAAKIHFVDVNSRQLTDFFHEIWYSGGHLTLN